MEIISIFSNLSLLIPIVLIVLFCLKVIYIYNKLIVVSRHVDLAWANIGVLLKQRHDELPKLVEACQQYMGYEQETLQQVMAARNSVHQAIDKNDVAALNQGEHQLRKNIGSLFALAENYPDLKATHSFQQLQLRITGLEEQLSDKREIYNESVNLNNIRVHAFPDMFVARLLNFGVRELLTFSEEEKRDHRISELFSR